MTLPVIETLPHLHILAKNRFQRAGMPRPSGLCPRRSAASRRPTALDLETQSATRNADIEGISSKVLYRISNSFAAGATYAKLLQALSVRHSSGLPYLASGCDLCWSFVNSRCEARRRPFRFQVHGRTVARASRQSLSLDLRGAGRSTEDMAN